MGEPKALSAADSTGLGAGRSRERWTFTLVVTAAFLCVGLVNILNHEMWCDELQPWLEARDAGSLSELFQNARTEGHPALWHLGLYAITRFTHNPEAMQAYHLLIAGAAMLVFLRWSPFSRLTRTLFVFGYFPLYEYASISRDYALGEIFLFVFCALAASGRRRNYLLLSIPLFLMAQSNTYALLLAVSLAGMLVFEACTDRDARSSLAARKGQALTGAIVFVAGVALAAVQILQPADSTLYPSWMTGLYPGRAASVFASFWRGYVPLPQLTERFWETNIVPSLGVQAALGAICLAAGVWFFRRRRTVLFFYLCSAAAIMSVQYLKTLGGLRHHGHLFLALVACLWLMRRGEEGEAPAGKRFAEIALIVFLSVHVAAGAYASVMDWIYPFSPAKATSEYIRANGLQEKDLLAGYQGNRMCSVVGYLDAKYFQLRGCRWGSFPINTKATEPNLPLFLERLDEMQAARKQDILLVLTDADRPPPGYVKLKEFPPGIASGDEDYTLYVKKYEARH